MVTVDVFADTELSNQEYRLVMFSALVPAVCVCKLFKTSSGGENAKAGNSCKLIAGIISPDLWTTQMVSNMINFISVLSRANLKYKPSYVQYWFIIAGEMNFVLNYHLTIWAEGCRAFSYIADYLMMRRELKKLSFDLIWTVSVTKHVMLLKLDTVRA